MPNDHSEHIAVIEQFARLDLKRHQRTGIPEAVFAEGKTHEQVIAALRTLADKSGVAMATRVSEECAKALDDALKAKFSISHNRIGRTIVVQRPGFTLQPTGGRIALLAAGTSDIPVAEEAKVSAEITGCEVLSFYDVGIAGIHRLTEPLKQALDHDVSAFVVVAGMEGALPSVIRGLVPVPVIGVPTSTGYGYGGKGEAALMSMLQSCAPGLTVVNIDNGFGAGATAALIANRTIQARHRTA